MKYITLILVVLLVGCGGESDDSSNDPEPVQEQPQELGEYRYSLDGGYYAVQFDTLQAGFSDSVVNSALGVGAHTVSIDTDYIGQSSELIRLYELLELYGIRLMVHGECAGHCSAITVIYSLNYDIGTRFSVSDTGNTALNNDVCDLSSIYCDAIEAGNTVTIGGGAVDNAGEVEDLSIKSTLITVTY